MRDIALALILFASLPVILWRPWIGILIWAWIGFMNPHRLTYGFAYDFPWAMLVGATTLIGLVLTKDRQGIPWTRETVILFLFLIWMTITSIFAFEPKLAWEQYEKVFKILVMVFVTLMLINSRFKLDIYLWVIVLSLGFYGFKGGIFTLTTGGGYHVMGPARSFIGGNNELGLALIMTFPLMRYLQLTSKLAILRWGMLVLMILTFVAILGTQSRGAYVGVSVMGAYLIWNSPKKVPLIALVLLVVPLVYQFMPESWHERMSTIETYEEDGSAQGRINAWWMAWNIAVDRPLVGGGFEPFQGRWFRVYAPNPDDWHDAHSIYFEVLGEHGFVGLGLFLALGLCTYLSAAKLARRGKREGNFADQTLGRMVQVGLIGYGAAGAFLGLAYFDLAYAFVSIVVLLKVMDRKQGDEVASNATPANGRRLDKAKPHDRLPGSGIRGLPQD